MWASGAQERGYPAAVVWAQPYATKPRRAVKTAPGLEEGLGLSHHQAPIISVCQFIDEAERVGPVLPVCRLSGPGSSLLLLCQGSLPRT